MSLGLILVIIVIIFLLGVQAFNMDLRDIRSACKAARSLLRNPEILLFVRRATIIRLRRVRCVRKKYKNSYWCRLAQ